MTDPSAPSPGNRPTLTRGLDVLSRWPATVLVGGVIFVLSELPQEALPRTPLFPHVDKVAHAIEYLVFGALLFRSLLHEIGAKSPAAAIIAGAFGATFGAFEEWRQGQVGRTADAADLLADVVGLVTGILLVRLLMKRRAKHEG